MVLYELLEIVFAYNLRIILHIANGANKSRIITSRYIRISGEQPPIMNNHSTTAPTIGSMECSIQ
ncbi:hypothetical protein T4A_9276 [Trichinella pseudospiralis]|uniref:Uncharacterized protein n=1 Tax=Trichinella pseudospiralis TaxID=6337 RepID=A0A0V1DDT1_TRIPS|nr:hypothetical protein T4A_9276 [Trichinella pseudospiralis]